MNIIYILTTMSIIILHMLLYKKEEKQNFLKYIILTLGITLCYNIVTCVILSFLKIKCTLVILSIWNVLFGILLGLKIFKDKKIQKYFINKMDIISIIVILIIVITLAIKQYGIPINMKHSITDGSTHYWAAYEFYNYSMLLLEENSDILNLFNEHFLMPGAYINTGILFKIFSPTISETYFCKLFVLFEVSMWCLSGLLMYVLLANNKKEEKQKIIPLIFSIIYMLAYPLNTILSGFSYLQLGLNIIIGIILVMQQELKQSYKSILLCLLNFGLMFSYYYFAPVVFLSIFIQMIIDIKKQKGKLFEIKNITNIIISLIIPGIFGIMYFIVFRLIKNGVEIGHQYSNVINIPGLIYSNFITNVLIFLVLSIYYIINCIKHKKQNITNKLFIITIVFLSILFIGMKNGKVSEYYYYKVYYMLWIYVIVNAFYAVDLLKEKRKILTYAGVGIYCIGIIISTILNKNLLIFDIYQKNFYEANDEYQLIKHEELEVLDYYNKNIYLTKHDMRNTYVYTIPIYYGRSRWMYAITKNPSIFIDLMWGEEVVNIQQFIDSDKQYCMIFELDYKEIFESIDEEVEKGTINILFRNDAGAILEKK